MANASGSRLPGLTAACEESGSGTIDHRRSGGAGLAVVTGPGEGLDGVLPPSTRCGAAKGHPSSGRTRVGMVQAA
jgi:hypothetical protein